MSPFEFQVKAVLFHSDVDIMNLQYNSKRCLILFRSYLKLLEVNYVKSVRKPVVNLNYPLWTKHFSNCCIEFVLNVSK